MKRLRQALRWFIERRLNAMFAVNKVGGLRRARWRDIVRLLAAALIFYFEWRIFLDFRIFVAVTQPFAKRGLWMQLIAALLVGIPLYIALNVVPALLKPPALIVLLLTIVPYEFARYVATRYIEDIYELSQLLWERDPRSSVGGRPSKKTLADGMRTANDFLMEAAFAKEYGRVRERKSFGCKLLFRLRLRFCPTEEECLKSARSRVYRPRRSMGVKEYAKFLWDWLVRGVPVGCPHVLGIVNGEVKDPYSPMLWIGGPGYVFISTDNAALFELPDGSWRVLGPTTDRLHLIEGFERLRRIVSLREHTSQFQVSARTRDGIRVTARDVRVLYRIYRGGRPSTPKNPYPFVPQAVRTLVLNERAVGVSDRWGRLSSSVTVANTLANMAKTELAKFVRSQTLVQLLASVFPPDLEMLQKMYRKIAEELAAEAQVPPLQGTLPLPEPPQFFPHTAIVERFNQMVNGPKGERARQRGVGIHWIGVGTFDPPIERIPQQHMEAWRLSVENMLRQNPIVLETLQRQRWASTILRNVQELVRAFRKSEEMGVERAVSGLLAEYVSFLEAALTFSPRDDKDDIRALLVKMRKFKPHNIEQSEEQ